MPPARKPPTGGEPPAPGAPERDAPEFANRKLIRPALADVRRGPGGPRGTSRKSGPPETTNAEAFYYLKQMQAKTPLVVRLMDGEELRGWIEWYDKDVIKLNRDGAPNLLLPKHAIKYLYKEEEERPFRRRRPREGREPREASGPGGLGPANGSSG